MTTAPHPVATARKINCIVLVRYRRSYGASSAAERRRCVGSHSKGDVVLIQGSGSFMMGLRFRVFRVQDGL